MTAAKADLFDDGRDPFSPAMLQTAKHSGVGDCEIVAEIVSMQTGHNEFRLTVEGEAVPKLSGSIVTIGGHGRMKANPKTRRYEDVVRQRATVAWNGRPLLRDIPLTMHVGFYREIPKSMTKRDRAAALNGLLRPITKPDCSNYVKAFEDGMKGVIFADDALIVTLHVEKHYSDRPRVEVALTW